MVVVISEARNSEGKQNPVGKDGRMTTCLTCDSKIHWAKDCQYSSENDPDNHEDKIHETNIVFLNDKTNLKTETSLMKQTIGDNSKLLILGSGCSRSVCGESRYESFLETLSSKCGRI